MAQTTSWPNNPLVWLFLSRSEMAGMGFYLPKISCVNEGKFYDA